MVINYSQAALVSPRTTERGRVLGFSRDLDVDAELDAMQAIGAVLAGLDAEARQCILAWAGARFRRDAVA